MKKFIFLLIGLLISCSTIKIDFSQLEISELEQKGYSIYLDTNLINLSNTYLNDKNILRVNQNTSTKKVEIIRKDKNTIFTSLNELLNQKKYNTKIDHIVINNIQIDNSEISKVKFEIGSIKYIRLLTQKDYQGKEYDDLPQVKEKIGNGMLIINTIPLIE
ncbi:hypothetical protein [Flavobacterium sp.]|uniref:hypothetical protein n=1 Tax=Flavobacterium sp. TaxID=239 RepID=UPI0008C17BEB|nr:hypothetical protein [Flavobacterium sp.]OGS63443.1 MAG: hypothetical protein A2X07_03575 [Flavobacteria bacterium GWF1_32_7]HBD27182.1 hypothetical protein [Flavobacterium sp.]